MQHAARACHRRSTFDVTPSAKRSSACLLCQMCYAMCASVAEQLICERMAAYLRARQRLWHRR
eukprot:6205320-Alexandrium_andersonii.AAC.1